MDAEAFALLLVIQPDGETETYHVSTATMTVGRSPSNDIVIDDPKASRVHLRLSVTRNACLVKDENSTNGTMVDGRRIESAVLSSGQALYVGATQIRFELLEAPGEEPEATVVLGGSVDLDAYLATASLDVAVADTNTTRLVIHTPEGTFEHILDAEATTIGRDPDNDIVLADGAASRRHALIERNGDYFLLRDLKSSNGTWFKQERIAERWLEDGDILRVGQTALYFKAAFTAPDATIVEAPVRARAGRKPVLIVPGLLGSELWRGSERLWPNVRHLFRHPEDYLLTESNPLDARAIVDQVVVVPNLISIDQYGRLRSFLEENLGYRQGFDLFEFPYDWRQDIRTSARQLARRVEELPITGPLVIIAHSMGSLVSRFYVEYLGGKHRVDRLIMMGAPHRGGPKAIQTLVSGAGLNIPFGLLSDGVQRAFSTYPSAYQLLPSYPAVFDTRGDAVDIFESAEWLDPDRHDLLRASREMHQQLAVPTSVPSVSIFGYGIKTMVRLNVDRTPAGRWKGFTFVERRVGDGTVPESSAVLPGSEIHPVRQHHGALYADIDVKKRLMLELTR